MKGGQVVTFGHSVLVEGGCLTYRNLYCDAGPGSGNNDQGTDYHYIMIIIISTNLPGPPLIGARVWPHGPHLCMHLTANLGLFIDPS